MSKDDWKSFDKQHKHEAHEVKFDLLGPLRRWLKKRREEKKRQLIAHQEAYALSVKAEEHRKAESLQRAKHNVEKQIQETIKMANELTK
jgi:hypothetical protein